MVYGPGGANGRSSSIGVNSSRRPLPRSSASASDRNVRGGSQNRASSANAPAPSIHPDLAPYLRGSQAPSMRARARAEQEERERARKEKEEREKTQPQGLQRVEEDEDAESDGVILVESSDTEETKRKASRKSDASAMQAKKSKPSPEPINLIDSDTEDEDARGGPLFVDAPTSLSSFTTPAAPPDTQANAAGEGDRIRLTLRSSTGSTLSVNVRRTTTFRRMLEHFASTAEKDGTARKAGMTAASIIKKARMVWDGETMKLDGAVGDVEELEEDELIDVLW